MAMATKASSYRGHSNSVNIFEMCAYTNTLSLGWAWLLTSHAQARDQQGIA